MAKMPMNYARNGVEAKFQYLSIFKESLIFKCKGRKGGKPATKSYG